MKRLDSIAELRDYRQAWTKPVGFVPTMGALHAGHRTLIERAKAECETVVVSIFVNPTQFNEPKDLNRYPRPLGQDLAMLEEAGVDAVFLPTSSEMYADQFRFEVREKRLSLVLCGPKRPGHFEGVLTVVAKLFNLIQPDKAYFGEKDYQQLRLIQDMVSALFMNVEVVPVATVREADGLAMSSRNLLLSAEERERAPLVYRTLKSAKTAAEATDILTNAGFRVDYIEEHWGRRFAAAYLGSVRLIDNVEL
jgi:pantoate--beta-alanine ligase